MISSMNDLRPVPLGSAVMKVCERVVHCKFNNLVKDFIDLLQFELKTSLTYYKLPTGKKKGVLMMLFYMS